MFFSATMPPEIHRLTTQFLHNPVRIEASAPSSTAASIEQYLVKVPHDAAPKRDALRALLRTQTKVKNGIVFANRKTTVALLEKSLRKHGFSAGALHGDMDQSARLKMLAAFRNNEVTYLIASDVAARGLDIPEVSHVFNFDVPIHAEDYVHRVGRTGRAGREGHAFTMVTREEAKYLRAIETLINKEIPYFDIGTVEDSGDAPEKEQRSARGGRKPGRHREKPADRAPAAKMPAAAKPVAARPAVEQPIAEKPAPQAKPPRQPEQRRARPERELEDAPESGGFHKGNMPAFLLRK
jgi:superfamily II DNA/RNA helicase